MSTNGTPNATSHLAGHTASDTFETLDVLDTPDALDVPEQLSLLAAPSVPLQFRLDERTRRTGLEHVAALRALMVAQAAERRTGNGRTARTARAAADRRIAA